MVPNLHTVAVSDGVLASWDRLGAPRFVRTLVVKIFKAMMAAAPQ
jgi:hypothetical protein